MNHDHIQSPGISIITPTHGRTRLLKKMLSSLSNARRFYPGETEVIIIDSSPPDESNLIGQACIEFDAQFHHMQNNVREKRNWGVKHAKHQLILFIDSDCQADVHLLVEHARTYEQTESRMLGGVVGLTRFVGNDNWVWQVIKRSSTLDAFSYPEHHEIVPWGPTCNISYRREVIGNSGFFDTSFPFSLGGDDVDLGIRVTDAGYLLGTNCKAIVEHDKATWSGISLISKREFRWGRMHFHLMCKHPRRVHLNPPTVPGIFLLLTLLFVPLGLGAHRVPWTMLPFLWLFLDLVMEALIITSVSVSMPSEFLYILGARILALIFQAGCAFEGLKNLSILPLYQDISYCPPSAQGRSHGIAQMWAIPLALIEAVFLLMIVQLLGGRS
jgi:glycosyltransferase involved in cell wall biosynthesis